MTRRQRKRRKERARRRRVLEAVYLELEDPERGYVTIVGDDYQDAHRRMIENYEDTVVVNEIHDTISTQVWVTFSCSLARGKWRTYTIPTPPNGPDSQVVSFVMSPGETVILAPSTITED